MDFFSDVGSGFSDAGSFIGDSTVSLGARLYDVGDKAIKAGAGLAKLTEMIVSLFSDLYDVVTDPTKLPDFVKNHPIFVGGVTFYLVYKFYPRSKKTDESKMMAALK